MLIVVSPISRRTIHLFRCGVLNAREWGIARRFTASCQWDRLKRTNAGETREEAMFEKRLRVCPLTSSFNMPRHVEFVVTPTGIEPVFQP